MAPVLLITPPAVGKRGAGMVPLAFQKNLEIVLRQWLTAASIELTKGNG